MEYVSHVLPALGEGAVEQRAVSELVDGLEPVAAEAREVARLKGDERMAAVLARAAELRLRGEPNELLVRLDGAFVRVQAATSSGSWTRCASGTCRRRERFRMGIVRSFYAEYGHLLGGGAMRDAEQVEKALRASGELRRVLDRAWPPVSPERLVRSLFTTPRLLAEAAAGILDDGEQRLLRRRGAGWSEADAALLDEAHALVGEPARAYDHVIVDEAQDLSPMQLRMIGRRAGPFTILGDIAQDGVGRAVG
jgi:hypothetical protein